MSFLAPLFLLGGLTIALPVIFHLIRRTTRERRSFSSLMFLTVSPPRLTRRSRLEHILLLVLRCAVLGLLALGFSRPLIKKAVPATPLQAHARRIAILLDTSASMQRDNLWSLARARAESILGRASPEDHVGLYTFDRQVNPIISFDQWTATPVTDRTRLALGKLAQVSPGWAGTHLGQALITVAEMLADNEDKTFSGPRQLIVISDLQEGCHLEALQGYEWPKNIEVFLDPIQAPRRSNASVHLAISSEETAALNSESVRLRIVNEAASKKERFKVGWMPPNSRSFAGHPLDLYVPAGESRMVQLPWGKAQAAAARIVLEGDDQPFDNALFVPPRDETGLDIFYFGSDSPDDPRESLYFVKHAFQQPQRQPVRVIERQPQQPVLAKDLQSTRLLIVATTLPEAGADALHEQVAAGKTLLFALDSESSGPTLARLLGLPGLNVEAPHTTNYAMLTEIDFRHPLFAPFSDPRYSDFSKIRFWNYCQVQDAASIPGARVLAKFDTGPPAILEFPVGKGRVVVLASGWKPAVSQLALSTKFVPLLYSLLEEAGGLRPLASHYVVGDVVPLRSGETADHGPWTVKLPTGKELKLTALETNFTQTLMPGIYSLTSAETVPRFFAVNLDPPESRTAPLAADDLEHYGVPLSRPTTAPLPGELARKTRLADAELENRQKLWRTLITAALALLLAETWLAGRATVRAPRQADLAT